MSEIDWKIVNRMTDALTKGKQVATADKQYITDHFDRILLNAISLDRIKTAKALLTPGFIPPAWNNKFLCLSIAIRKNLHDVVALLIKAGAPLLSSEGLETEKALTIPLQQKNWKMIKTIVSAKKAANATESYDFEYSAALTLAVKEKETSIAKLLIKQGTKYSSLDSVGTVTLNHAILTSQNKLIKPLIDCAHTGLDRDIRAKAPIHLAAVAKNWKAVKEIALNYPATSLNQNISRGFDAALLEAVKEQQTDVINLLLEKGAKASYAPTEYLCAAVNTGQLNLIKPLVAAGARLDHADFTKTPMYVAISKNWEAAKELASAKKAATAAEGQLMGYDRALSYAIKNHLTSLAKLLLAQGAKENRLSIHDAGFLYHAVNNGLHDLIQPLIEAGAILHHSDVSLIPMNRAIQKEDWTAVRLIAKAKKANGSEAFRWCYDRALLEAIHNYQKDVALLLLEQGARPFAVGWNGANCLNEMIETGQYALLPQLLNAKAPLNSTSPAKRPLINAINKERWDIAETLIKHKHVLNFQDCVHCGYDAALNKAIENKKTRIAKLLLEQGAIPLVDACRKAVEYDQTELIEPLIKAGATLTDPSFHNTPLFMAASKNNWEAVRIIVSAKKVTSAKESNDLGYGATLLQALHMGQLDIARLLLAQGAVPGTYEIKSTRTGNRSLHQAVLLNQPDIVYALIKNGVDPSLKNKAGQTAADLAKKLGFTWYQEVIKSTSAENAISLHSKHRAIKLLQAKHSSLLHSEHSSFRRRDSNITEALNIFDTISNNEAVATPSNETIAEYLYSFAINSGYSPIDAFELAKPYFEKNIADVNCSYESKELYHHALLFALDKNGVEPDDAIDYSTEETKQVLLELKAEYENKLQANLQPPIRRTPADDKAIFAGLIDEFKLNDIKYWQKQVRFGGGCEITVDGKKVKVPHVIANLRELLFANNPTKNLWKLYAIDVENENNKKIKQSNIFSRAITFFKRTEATRKLHEAIEDIKTKAHKNPEDLSQTTKVLR